jgi:hypothetical protein
MAEKEVVTSTRGREGADEPGEGVNSTQPYALPAYGSCVHEWARRQ